MSLRCLVRNLPLFFRAAPRTPLRVLCIIALDILHVLRYWRPLSKARRLELATFLDFQACTNAAWDRKDFCADKYQALQQRLEHVGLGWWVNAYLDELRALETRRPGIGGDQRRFDDVRAYREAVARLALATITSIALKRTCVAEGIQATHCDRDVATLLCIAMQCQIIDDVMDYGVDLRAGLPSFMTASSSLPQAMALTATAAQSYAGPAGAAGHGVLPLRLALSVVSAVTRTVVHIAQPGLQTFAPDARGLTIGDGRIRVDRGADGLKISLE